MAPAPLVIDPATLPAARRPERVRNHPNLLAMPLSGRLRAVVTGEASGAAPNRRDRRALKAVARRRG